MGKELSKTNKNSNKSFFSIFFVSFLVISLIIVSSFLLSGCSFSSIFSSKNTYLELPVNYIVNCSPGVYNSPYQGFKAVRFEEKLHTCFVYKYYDWAILKDEDLQEYRAQKEPFGEICVYPLDKRNAVEHGFKTQEDVLKEVGCQPVLNLQTDVN